MSRRWRFVGFPSLRFGCPMSRRWRFVGFPSLRFGWIGTHLFVTVAVFGIATVAFGLSQNFYLSLAALLVTGASDMISVFIRSSLINFATPDPMRGRVGAVNMLFIGASGELGEFESGMTAAWFGTIPAVVIGGLGTLAVVAIWMWLFPPLRKVDRLADALTPS
jgi:hypothetical protein